MKRFLVVNAPRTGSTWLRKALNCHPEVLCADEILHPNRAVCRSFLAQEGISLPPWRLDAQGEYVERFFAAAGGARRAVGFKIIYRDLLGAVLGGALQHVLRQKTFRRALPRLACAFALSRYLGRYLEDQLGMPVTVLTHPTETGVEPFDLKAHLESPRSLVQVGWYLKNTRAIHQVPPVPGYRRIRLRQWIRPAAVHDWKVRRYWRREGNRREYPGVETLRSLDGDAYDRMLTRSVVLMEVFDASANNVVVECLARNTPLVVNRHPAVEEYLGPEYPLYFDDIRDVPSLLTNERVAAASAYLALRDKEALDPARFVQDLVRSLGVRRAR